MEFFSFIGDLLLSVLSFIFHLILSSASLMLLVSAFFKKATIRNERIVLYAHFFIGVVIGPVLAVYFTAINPQALDVFYDKLWRYKATEMKIEFSREPSNTVVQESLQSIAKAFPDLQTNYPTIRVFTRRGVSSGRLVGSAKVMPHYWKKEGNQVFLYLSDALSDSGIKAIKADINQRFLVTSTPLTTTRQ